MRFRGAAAALLVLTAAACDEGPPPEQAPAIKIANPHHDQLMALNPDMQRLGVMRAIRDNGMRCQRVEATRYQEDYRNMALWVALCNDGRHWALFIAPNGDTQVRQCSEMRELGLPQCRPADGTGTAANEGS
ncbi:hypothetical protein [Sphingosinicella sp. CPCC 101087]|uniref:hypothetical protein n=1 Tax=Sphingosinicella sp. CPCC 101087 TaxID=2497754 RepID=UPI00101DDC6F|nr:hypothetical protein [Sphingosinicella sp. CPCC 101087]